MSKIDRFLDAFPTYFGFVLTAALTAAVGLVLLSPDTWSANAIVNCATTSLGQAYGANSFNASTGAYAPPKVQSVFVRKPATLAIFNASSARICASILPAGSSLPSAANGFEYCVPATSNQIFPGVYGSSNLLNVYLRGDGANCTSNIVDVELW